jgi:hypothetical protein
MSRYLVVVLLTIASALVAQTGCVGDVSYLPPPDSGNDGGDAGSGGDSNPPDTDASNDSPVLPDGAVCFDGTSDCQGPNGAPRSCVGGQWQIGSVCSGSSPICLAGQCVQCNPNDTQCDINTVQQCDNTGHWQDKQACADPDPTCQGGKCVCTNTVCGGSCVDLQKDTKNCGSCGHDCQGGTCNLGVCQDVTLASSQVSPYFITTDGTNVYWTNSSSVVRVPVGGGSTTTIASGQSSAEYIAVDSTNVYWVDDSSGGVIKTCLKTSSSCTPTIIASGQAWNIGGIAIDSTNIYWTPASGSGYPAIVSCSKSATNCTPTTLITATQTNDAVALATDGTTLYWTDGNANLVMCTLGSCSGTKTTLITGYPGSLLAIDGSNIYWAPNSGSLAYQCDRTNPSKCGGSLVTLASGESAITGITVDSSNVYWSTNGGSGDIRQCKIGGCGGTPKTVGSGPGSKSYGVALDTTSIYWSNSGGSGSIMKIAK